MRPLGSRVATIDRQYLAGNVFARIGAEQGHR
ncbi:MAG: hypothetical protein RLZZ344_1567, partial [Pseudomonadota bacterium]